MRTPAPEPGVYPNVPAEVYHSWDAVSMSVLREMDNSPLRCKHVRDNGSERSAAKDVGSLLHACMLEPSRIDRDVIPPPGRSVPDKETGAVEWKEYGRDTKAWEKYEAANPGKMICSDEERNRVRAMLAKFRENKYAMGALFDPKRQTEVSVVWRDELTGLPCKCRPDVVLVEALPDLKTTSHPVISTRWLRKHATDYGWFHRDPWYRRGWKAATGQDLPVWFILAQSVPPHEIVVARISDAARAGASRQIDDWLIRYAKCESDQQWPGVAPEPITINGYDWLEVYGSTLEGIDMEHQF